jgi:hypothetical protein
VVILADGPNVWEFFLEIFILPSLFCLVAALTACHLVRAVSPGVQRIWMGSDLRECWLAVQARYRALSKARMTLAAGLTGNLFVAFVCLPLLRVPVGAGIKPMGQILSFLVAAALCGVAARQVSANAWRPDGNPILRAVGVILCFLPLIVGVTLMHLFAAMRNLSFG